MHVARPARRPPPQALYDMRVDRIGHGYAAARNATLLGLVKGSGVHLEACPGTALAEGSMSAIGAFRAANVSFGLNEARRRLTTDGPRGPLARAM